MSQHRLYEVALGSPLIPLVQRRLQGEPFLSLNSVADAAKPFVAALLAQPSATQSGRGEIIAKVLAERTYLIHARDRVETLEVIERFAPEHLSLQIADPWSLVPLIRRAGAIFMGDHTPVAAGDYIAGSNHVLPTSGAARFSSGLRTADFYRTMSVVENSAERMERDASLLAALANFEGLPAHARTAEMRKGM